MPTDTMEMLAERFGQHAVETVKQLKENKAATDQVKAHVLDLEQMVTRGGGGVPAAPESWGQQFIKGAESQIHDLAERGLSGPSRVSHSIKAFVSASAGNMGDITYDGVTRLPQQGLRLRSLIPTVSIGTNAVEYVEQQTRPTGAAAVAEGAAKPESDMTFALKTTNTTVIAHWMKASKQVLSDVGQLADIIDTEMRYGLALKEEGQILYGDGVGANLLGMVPQATAFADPLALSSPNRMDQLGAAALQVALADFEADAIVLHPSDLLRIRLMKDTAGWYLMDQPNGDPAIPRLWGLPIVSTRSMTVGRFLVGNFREAATIYDRWAPRVETGYVNDDFTRNMVTILAEERLAMAVKQKKALVYGTFA